MTIAERSARTVLKAVIDANVWINALLGGPNGLAIVEKLEQERFQLVFAEELVKELIDVLSRSKFSLVRSDKRDRLFALIREKAVFVKLEITSNVCRDAKDEMYLACALTGQADLLVSGDEDLLCLAKHHETRIVTSR